MKLLYFKKRKRERFSGAPLRYNWFSLIFWHPTPFLKYTFYSFQLKTCISVTLYSFLLVFLFNYQSTFICKASNKNMLNIYDSDEEKLVLIYGSKVYSSIYGSITKWVINKESPFSKISAYYLRKYTLTKECITQVCYLFQLTCLNFFF